MPWCRLQPSSRNAPHHICPVPCSRHTRRASPRCEPGSSPITLSSAHVALAMSLLRGPKLLSSKAPAMSTTVFATPAARRRNGSICRHPLKRVRSLGGKSHQRCLLGPSFPKERKVSVLNNFSVALRRSPRDQNESTKKHESTKKLVLKPGPGPWSSANVRAAKDLESSIPLDETSAICIYHIPA